MSQELNIRPPNNYLKIPLKSRCIFCSLLLLHIFVSRLLWYLIELLPLIWTWNLYKLSDVIQYAGLPRVHSINLSRPMRCSLVANLCWPTEILRLQSYWFSVTAIDRWLIFVGWDGPLASSDKNQAIGGFVSLVSQKFDLASLMLAQQSHCKRGHGDHLAYWGLPARLLSMGCVCPPARRDGQT